MGIQALNDMILNAERARSHTVKQAAPPINGHIEWRGNEPVTALTTRALKECRDRGQVVVVVVFFFAVVACNERQVHGQNQRDTNHHRQSTLSRYYLLVST